ncbi:alkyl sulfatase dimerization domain-containing protein [Sphingobium sp. TCM1]|uniref:alkyl sulfatase dimerization domain-containing protein n=1 Tax=Sphingobium sp. TCM1 TaxID=453246 RepID=UPI0007F55B51|nr:alkyl sulfatase dimerization domain-containing protein [Sphingobium sp. TCM1]OAN56266.1 hypothetical protein A7Q26_02370 [Sphingobium sp. TCM1]
MPRYSSADHPLIQAVAWEPEKPAERVNDHILYSRGTSNAHLVTTTAGDIVINSGMSYQGPRHRERFEQLLGRPLDVRTIILTQSHPDHLGGWADFADDRTETIVTRLFPDIQRERAMLNPFFGPRGARIVGNLMPDPRHLSAWKPEANVAAFEAATRFVDSHAFTQGDTRVQLYATPSGETIDALIVWLPDHRTAFTGNFLGALYGALPHFYTPRGDRDRSIPQFLRDVQKLIDLQPALLITGHGAPIEGADRIAGDLTRLRDAVRFLHDNTVEGMNAGKSLYQLMQAIRLPPELKTAPGRGPERWYVRAIWEEYTGWFRQESTTELYGVAPAAIWPELAAMAGGADMLVAAAQAHLAAGRPVEALHMLDVAQAADPSHVRARRIEIAALEALIAASGGESHDELTWLEWKIGQARQMIGEI